MEQGPLSSWQRHARRVRPVPACGPTEFGCFSDAANELGPCGRLFAENGLGQKTDSRQWTTLPLSAAWVFAESVFRYEDPATSKQTMVRVFRRGLAVRFSEKRTCHFSGEVDVSFQKTEQKTECCPSRGTRNHRPFRKTDSGVRNGRCKDPVSSARIPALILVTDPSNAWKEGRWHSVYRH